MDDIKFINLFRVFENPISKYVFGLIIIVLIIRGLFKSKSHVTEKSIPTKDKVQSGSPLSASETIGEISVRLGEDVREIWIKGYSDDQINDVLTGKNTLDDMYKMEPKGNNRS
jgi:hypothetical protein